MSARQARPTKICASCGRVFAWRKAWERDWDAVEYCSQGCRRHRPTAFDRTLETAILDLLAKRPINATICPSEAARLVGGDEWRAYSERTRRAARRLAAAGAVCILQRGRVVDPGVAGPIRIARVR